MNIKIIRQPISRSELLAIARAQFGDMVKAVVDMDQKIMAVGGELHADAEVLLAEQENSKREHTWGINLYPEKSGEDWIEFDSMINLKPSLGNRSRGVESAATRDQIKQVVGQLILN